VAAIALAAWVVARAFTSPVAYLARTDLLMVLAALIMYFGTVMVFRTQRSRLVLTGVLLALALVHVVVGARQFKHADNFMLLPGIMRPTFYEWRASGLYICPNHLAGLLEMLAFLTLSLAFWGNSRPRTRVLAGFCALVWFGGVAITGSRGGYLSVAFGLCAFAVFSLFAVWLMRRGSFFVTLAGMLVCATLLLGGGFLFMSQSESINERLSHIYDPSNMRVYLWKGALQQFHLRPLIGTGSGTTLYFSRQFRAPQVQNDPMHAHDDYLELVSEYGIVGAALCGIFLLVHGGSGLVGVRKIVREQIPPGAPGVSNDLAMTVGALAAIAALLFHSLLDFNMHIPANALFVAFLFGLLASPVCEDSLPEAPVRPAGVWRWLVAGIAAALLVMAVRFWPGEIYAEKARVALRDDRNADALAFARQGIAWEKKNPYLYSYLGEAQHFLTLSAPNEAAARALHEEAIAAYGAGLTLFPHDTGLLLKQAQDLDLLGRYGAAEENFQRLLQYDPLFENVYAYYGLHWQLQRRILTAERCFRVAQNLGEREIAPRALANIERMKRDPVTQSLISFFPDVGIDLPAERALATP
jgi:O-antigen ligase